ncbi:prepilin-type N-terminal cleavage/methylation domain-containing protein [Diaphorobacter sp. HDW4B]|uniref:prepilin-type N-terminal cleavage/methylation domain-containing protein n=1 Tax=Diaphorobacter sp. HDW4B TaxID=2714925 RepID=UPI00140ACD0F|nr:prepilin-type N-terminal cleavage/methylation domain-containing protein [Diaphorobacter sp. HDW4B]QIL70230.1 prepilin-type N-terminal cleavage/methylation domain-containing protein [Diaphorobacter sp. HDW4B]
MRGFTLLEMLVVMVLLSIIMLALVSAMRGAGQSSERVDAKFWQQDEARVAENFVRGTLGRVSARPLPAGTSLNQSSPSTNSQLSGKPPVLFMGQPNEISWVGILPARYGAGGRSFFHLAVEPTGNTSSLVLRYGPWADQNAFPDWGGLSSQVLLTDVVGLVIQYENDKPENIDANSEWMQAWDRPDYLPSRVMIGLQRGTQLPLEWVVPLRGLPASWPEGLGRPRGPVIGGAS